jgi:hypothetical protein
MSTRWFCATDDSKILINAAKTKGFPSKSIACVCTYRSKDNHIVDNCYKKHGLPPHLRNKFSATNVAIEGDCDDTIAAQDTNSGSSTITQKQVMQLIASIQNFP